MVLLRPKIFSAILILLTALFLTGCQNPLVKEKPEKVVADMFAQLSTLESVAFNSAISVSEEGSNQTTDAKIDGQTDFSQQDQQAADVTLDITSQSGQGFKLKGQVRLAGQELYLKIDEFSDQETLTKLGIKPSEWYAVGQELRNILESFGYPAQDKNTKNQSGLSAEQKQKVRALIGRANFVKIEETLPEEEVAGQKCYHYRISFLATETEKFFSDLGEIIGNLGGLDLIKEYFSPTDNRTYEIWIGQDDHWLRRIAGQNVVADETLKTKTKSSFIAEFTRFNEQFNITVPEKIEELNLEKLSIFGSGQIINSNDLKKDTDQDGLSDFVESIYQTDPKNPDTDSDGYSDGEEVEHGFNPLGPGKLNPASF